MPIIVDGYNLLWSIQKSSEESQHIDEATMCHTLGRYFSKIKDTGEIIFDGIGPPDKSRFGNVSSAEIIFSGTRIDADSMIEDKIKVNTAPKRLTVVSSDMRLRRAAKARKAVSMKSEVFWVEVLKELARKSAVKEPLEKRMGLSETETDEWMKLFDVDQ